MNRITRYIRFLKKNLYCKISPIKYYRSIGVKIGKGTKFYTRATDIFSSEPWVVTIGENCHIAGGVKFLTHDGGTLILPKEEGGDFVLVGDIVVGNNVYFGFRSIIMPGVKIGNDVIVGAGAIVTKDVEDGCIVAGVPARVISTKAEYTKKVLGAKAGENSRFYSDLDLMHSKNPKNQKVKF